MKVIDGEAIWRIKATYGLPLDFALARLAQASLVPSWDRLFAAAARDGVNLRKLRREIQFFVREAYPADDARQINSRLEVIL